MQCRAPKQLEIGNSRKRENALVAGAAVVVVDGVRLAVRVQFGAHGIAVQEALCERLQHAHAFGGACKRVVRTKREHLKRRPKLGVLRIGVQHRAQQRAVVERVGERKAQVHAVL